MDSLLKRKKALQMVITIIFLMIITISIPGTVNAEYPRKIVFEEFTEVWCGPCAGLAPMLHEWLDSHPDYIPVTYTSYFMIGSQKKRYDQTGYNARKTFYDVPFYPFAMVNTVKAPNEKYPGFPTDTSRINSVIDTMTRTTPVKVNVDFINNGLTGKVKVELTSEVALEDKRLHVMIVEKSHHYPGQPNHLDDYHHIMRQVITEPYGEVINIDADEIQNFEYDYSLDDDIIPDLFATVLVQDPESMYIYQAESVFKASPASPVEELTGNPVTLKVFPNPAGDYINVSIINGNNGTLKQIKVLDMFGRVVKNTETNGNDIQMNCSDIKGIPFAPGVYVIKISTGNKIYMKKIIKQ